MRSNEFPASQNTMEGGMDYPKAHKSPIVESLHGFEVRDDFRWLEDETDPRVVEWVKKQNTLSAEYLESPLCNAVYERLLEEQDVFSRGSPFRRGSRYFWYERQPGQQHYVLFSAEDPVSEKDKQLVYDVNELSEDGSIDCSFFAISRNGEHAVYGIQESGSERDEIYIRDLHTGEDQKFYYGRTFTMSWCDDGEGFYYTRSDYESHGGDETDETHYQQVYYHKLGDDREDDKLIFNAYDYLPKDAGVGAHDSEDGCYVALNVSVGWSERHIFIYDSETEEINKIVPESDTKTSLSIFDGYAYLTTDHGANNRKILRSKLEETTRPIEEWEEFLPEDDERLLEGWSITKSEILVCYTHNVLDIVERYDRRSGSYIGRLDLPNLASVNALATNKEDDDFYYSVNTFFTPSTKYYFDPATQKSEVFYEDPRSLDPEQFVAEQRWFESKDGTEIPMFFIAPNGYEERIDNPVSLNGYGGFNLSRGPGYVGGAKPWLEAGGIIVNACLRGGGEFGEEWHKAGMRQNKQNTFDDFITAAEYLIDQNITDSEHLIIKGGSNGGLLVGAAITQRPDLFKAAVCAVPLLDMYRYHGFLMAHRWTHEYGNPDNAEEFEWLKKYSPYHHVSDEHQYPSLLLTAGMNDSRVHPMHAWKMAAKLQSGHPNNFVLLKTEMAAGHGPGKGFYQSIQDQSEVMAFMMQQAGIETDLK